MTDSRAIDRRQTLAIAVSAGILIATGCYWIAQILGVIEMLRLAYG